MAEDTRGDEHGENPEKERTNPAATVNMVLRAAVLVLSTGVMIAGLALALGFVRMKNLPDEFRLVAGIVVFLYGLYRFVLTFGRIRRR